MVCVDGRRGKEKTGGSREKDKRVLQYTTENVVTQCRWEAVQK